MDLKEKVVVVTGSSRGIGKAIAIFLAGKGCKITVNYTSGTDAAERTVKEIEGTGGKAILVKADVTKQSEVRSMFQAVLDRFGRVDGLVNNAGALGHTHLLEITEEEWDHVLAVNLKGVFNCCQAVMPIFLKQSGGKIVNMSSIAGKMGGQSGVHYGASKAGVIALTMALSTEFARKNIHVNAICPGPVNTEMFQSLPASLQEHFANTTHLGRACEPSEIAHGVAFLLENDFMTGETLNMSAGRYMD